MKKYAIKKLIKGSDLYGIRNIMPDAFMEKIYVVVPEAKLSDGECTVTHKGKSQIVYEKDKGAYQIFKDKKCENKFYRLYYFEWTQ